jgi:light-harvesting complex I chlorophyll a/b binding protein 1
MKTVAALAMMATSASAFSSTPLTTSTCSSSNTFLEAVAERKWDTMVDKTQRSKSVPFLPRAISLDGSYVGDKGFDPFYLSSISKNFAGFIQPPSWEEQKGIPTLYWMREAELKHSRVAMLAWLGWRATDDGLRLPGDIFSFDSIPTAYEAHNAMVDQGVMTFMLMAVGFAEICSAAVLVQVSKGESDREAGDFGFDPLGISKGKSKEQADKYKLKEIENGRLAMLAFGGLATQTALGDATHAFPYF